MLGESFAQRQILGARLRIEVGVNAGRRRWNRHAENVIQQPLSAQHRRRTVGIRGRREERAFGQQPATLIVVWQCNPPEPAAVNIVDTVVLCEPLIQETVISLEQIQNVNCRQTPLERLLDVGTVSFDTAGGAAFEFSFTGIDEPHRIIRTVDQALHGRALRSV